MSADNGVYILRTIRRRKFANGAWTAAPEHFVYRVAYAGAIDNFFHYKETDPSNLGAYLLDIWGKSRVYENKQEASDAAYAMLGELEKTMYVEYGVGMIEADIVFYKDM